MQFWLSFPFLDTEQYVPLAKMVEAADLDGIATTDHICFPDDVSSHHPYPADGRPYWRDHTHWPDPIMMLGAMAAATSRVAVATHVLILPLRHPVLVAKSVSTAAVLGGGRVGLGCGVGWMREEFDAVGVDFRTRGRRTDEAIEVMRLLWTGELVEYHGEHFDFEPIRMWPPPPEPPPILIGGETDVAKRRAARLGDGWAGGRYLPPEDFVAVSKRLRTLLHEAGRASEPFDIRLPVEDPRPEIISALADLGVTQVILRAWDRDHPGDAATLEGKARALERFGNDVLAKLR